MNENKGKNPKKFLKRLLTGVLAAGLMFGEVPSTVFGAPIAGDFDYTLHFYQGNGTIAPDEAFEGEWNDPDDFTGALAAGEDPDSLSFAETVTGDAIEAQVATLNEAPFEAAYGYEWIGWNTVDDGSGRVVTGDSLVAELFPDPDSSGPTDEADLFAQYGAITLDSDTDIDWDYDDNVEHVEAINAIGDTIDLDPGDPLLAAMEGVIALPDDSDVDLEDGYNLQGWTLTTGVLSGRIAAGETYWTLRSVFGDLTKDELQALDGATITLKPIVSDRSTYTITYHGLDRNEGETNDAYATRLVDSTGRYVALDADFNQFTSGDFGDKGIDGTLDNTTVDVSGYSGKLLYATSPGRVFKGWGIKDSKGTVTLKFPATVKGGKVTTADGTDVYEVTCSDYKLFDKYGTDLWAVWSPISYTVHYTDGGATPKTIADDTVFTYKTADTTVALNAPTAVTGYDFKQYKEKKTDAAFDKDDLKEGYDFKRLLAYMSKDGKYEMTLTAPDDGDCWDTVAFTINYKNANVAAADTPGFKNPSDVYTSGASGKSVFSLDDVDLNSEYYLPASATATVGTGATLKGWSLTPNGASIKFEVKGTGAEDKYVKVNKVSELIALSTIEGAVGTLDLYPVWTTSDDATVTLHYDYDAFSGAEFVALSPDITATQTGKTPTATLTNGKDSAAINITGIENASTREDITVGGLKTVTATLEGYRFGGWFPDGSDGIKAADYPGDWASYVVPTSNTLDLYAKWIPNEYTVSYDGTAGTIENTVFTYNGGASYAIAAPDASTYKKAGYDFYGWTDAAAEVVADSATAAEIKALDGSATGKFLIKKDDAKITKDMLIKAPKIAMSQTSTGEAGDWTETKMKIELKPVWVKSNYTVTFHTGDAVKFTDGTLAGDARTFAVSDKYEKKFTVSDTPFDFDNFVPELKASVADGWHFSGWTTTEGDSEGLYKGAAKVIDVSTPAKIQEMIVAAGGSDTDTNIDVYPLFEAVEFYLMYYYPESGENTQVNGDDPAKEYVTAGDYNLYDGGDSSTLTAPTGRKEIDNAYGAAPGDSEAKDYYGTAQTLTYETTASAGTFTLQGSLFTNYNGQTFKGWNINGNTYPGGTTITKTDKDDPKNDKDLVVDTTTFESVRAWTVDGDATADATYADGSAKYFYTAVAEPDLANGTYSITYSGEIPAKVKNTKATKYTTGDGGLDLFLPGYQSDDPLNYLDPTDPMYVEGKHFVRYQMTSSNAKYAGKTFVFGNDADRVYADANYKELDVDDGNGWEIPTDGYENMTITAVYLPNEYYIGVSKTVPNGNNTGSLTGDDDENTSHPTTFAYTGVLSDNAFEVPENKAFIGWEINGKVYAAGTKISTLVNDGKIFEAKKEATMDLADDNELKNTASQWAYLNPVFAAPYKVIYQHDVDGKGTTIESTSPADFGPGMTLSKDAFSESGKALYEWQKVNGWSATNNGTVDSTSTLKPGLEFNDVPSSWFREDSTEHVNYLVLRAKFVNAYTINLSGGGKSMSLVVAEDDMDGTSLQQKVTDTILEELKAKKDNSVDDLKLYNYVNWQVSGDPGTLGIGYYFRPEEEGKHFEGKVAYGTVKNKAWNALTLTTLKTYMTGQKVTSVDVTLELEANKYNAEFRTTNADGTTQTPTVQAPAAALVYDKEYDPTVKSTSAVAKANPWGTIKQWKMYELTPGKDEFGLTYLPGDANYDTTLTYVGTVALDTKLSKLTKYNGATVILEADYTPKSFTVAFAPGTPKSGTTTGTVTGSMANRTVKYGDDAFRAKIVNAYKAEGFAFLGWLPKSTGQRAAAAGVLTANGQKASTSNPYLPSVTIEDMMADQKYPETLTLTAAWGLMEYGITYHLEGGTFVGTNQKYTYTIAGYELPALKSETGYTVGGWYYDSAFKKPLEYNSTSKKWKIEAGHTGNVDLYVKWAPSEVEVTYNSNYPSGLGLTNATQKEKYKYNVDSKVWNSTWKATGYTLVGWGTAAGGTDVVVPATGTFAFTTQKSLYARWAKKGETTYTLTLTTDAAIPFSEAPTGFTASGTNYKKTWKFGESVKLPTMKTSNDQYTFAKWLDENGTEVKKISATTAGDLTLTASWTGKKYTVTYDSNKAGAPGSTIKGSTKKQTVHYGATWAPEMSGFTATGYTFNGWNTAADGTGTAYNVMADGAFQLATYDKKENLKLYAQWKAATQRIKLISGHVDATIVGNGVTDITAAVEADDFGYDATTYMNSLIYALDYEFSSTTKKVTLPTPTLTGATFKGWFKAATNAAGDYIIGTKGKKLTSVKAGDTGVYVAKWAGTYSIVYKGDNGEEVTQKATYGKKTKLKKLPKSWKEKDKNFVGWTHTYGDDDVYRAGEKIVKNLSDIVIDSNGNAVYELYPVYVDNNKKYNLNVWNDGAIVYSTTFKYKSGLSSKKLKKIGKKVAKDNGLGTFRYFQYQNGDGVATKLTKIKKKTAGDLDVWAECWNGLKTTVKFVANNPAGTKVKGKVSDKKISWKEDETKNLIKGANKFKVDGYKLVGYATDPDQKYTYNAAAEEWYSLSADRFWLTAGGKLYANDILDAFPKQSSITVYGIWTPVDATYDYYNYYYDLDAADAVFDDSMVTDHQWYDKPNGEIYDKADVANNAGAPNYWYQTYVSGALPRPSRLGYNFAGWLELQPNGTWKKTTETVTSARTRYFKASWTKVS